MPYKTDHKTRTHQRILESARRLFSSKGFDATSIEEIMLECKLTRGGFYAHFQSKAQLYHEAMTNADSPRALPLTADEMSARWLDALLTSCLGSTNSNGIKQSPWTFLVTDVVSKQPEVRKAYAQAFKAMSERLCQEIEQSSNRDRSSLALMAMAVGALAVAMAIDDASLRTSLISACREHAKSLFENTDKHDRLDFFWTQESRDAHGAPSSLPMH
jgi:TetR/AcrR family transcriptional repressor of nem operon